MARERIITAQSLPEDQAVTPEQPTLRPKTLNDYIGQRELIEKLRISISAARQRGEAMEHVLLHGPPGLGKTTLAYIIAAELNGTIPKITSGPALARPTELVSMLTNMQRGDVLFIDEIHRIPTAVEEYLYPAMEDFCIDVVMGTGTHANSLHMEIQPFTLIGATTRAGLLSGPMRSRFGIVHHLSYYDLPDLLTIATRSAGVLNLPARKEALELLARRARGTPRVANRLLRRVRDFALVRGEGQLTSEIAVAALQLEGIDEQGLDALDRRFMQVLARDYEGGPAGIEALAATMGEESDTLEDVIEPFLLQTGFIRRTPKGRQLTAAGYGHLKLTAPARLAVADDALFQ
ncbi:MAG: Holliday junction branch migration DNA helicase RuvB [Phycisphaerae bacterium]